VRRLKLATAPSCYWATGQEMRLVCRGGWLQILVCPGSSATQLSPGCASAACAVYPRHVHWLCPTLHPDPCSQTAGRTGWVHEIKHDGYRLQVRRVGDQVRLFTRRGYYWSGRYPSIAVTATLLRARSFTLDGEAVVCGPDGVAIFDALHRRGTVTEAMLYAFDLLELDGADLRGMPLGDRKNRLASRDWLKVKNPDSPAMIRAREADW
jgi:hypothetical protein